MYELTLSVHLNFSLKTEFRLLLLISYNSNYQVAKASLSEKIIKLSIL